MAGSSFSALRHRQFRLIGLGFISAAVGANAMNFALGWLLVQLALREGHPELAPFYIGLVGASRGVPGLVFGLLGGVFADRMDRRMLLVVTRLVAAIVAFAMALLVFTDHVHLVAVIALNAVGAIADAMDLPLRQSTVARILPPGDLISAQGLTNSTFSLTGIVSPLIAGLLIGVIGIGGLMTLSAVGALIAVGLLSRLAPVPPSGTTHASVIRSLGDGLLYVMRDPVLRWVVLLSATASVFVRPLQQLMPAVAQSSLGVGATELSWLFSLMAVGGFAGAVVAMTVGALGRQGRLILVCVICWGLLNMLFGLQHELLPALLLVAFPQLTWSAFASLCQVLCQSRAPDHLRGRALSMYGVSLSAFMPLGALVLGSLGTIFNVSTAIMIGGAITTAVAICVLVTSTPMRDARIAGHAEVVAAIPEDR